MSNQNPANQLMDIALRIRDMREILGYSMQKMAELTDVSEENYKLYETTNLWTFLKLDTRTGKIWQVQYSVKGPEYRFESVLNAEDLSYGNTKPGKYELYKTQNMYNFILLDKVEGKTWQVQWGEEDSRMVLRIY